MDFITQISPLIENIGFPALVFAILRNSERFVRNKPIPRSTSFKNRKQNRQQPLVSDSEKGGFMNPERLQLKGMLAESKKNFRTLDTEASGLVILIRALLNPYEDIKNLDMDKVLVTVQRLKEVSEEMRTLSEKIKRLESELE